MQGNQLRKNAAGAIIHNNINSYPILSIPMIINKEDGIIYECLYDIFLLHQQDSSAGNEKNCQQNYLVVL
ncbi:hypothetical protein ACWKTX_29745 [Bacillus thuringiensis]